MKFIRELRCELAEKVSMIESYYPSDSQYDLLLDEILSLEKEITSMNNSYMEELFEMAIIRPKNIQNYGILLSINIDDCHHGDPYFKMYNTTSYNSATKVWRIKFDEPTFIKLHQGKVKAYTSMSKDEKNKLIKYLSESSRKYKGHTIWDELKYEWNDTKGFMDTFDSDDYFSGKVDSFYKDKNTMGDYLPLSLEMPDYSKL